MNLATHTGGLLDQCSGDPRALETVLIAEDDPMFRQVLSSLLKKWNYRVITVENGLDAWTILQQKDAPQMAILDWIMPVVDGVELCRRLRNRESGPYRYVILITAKDGKQDVVTGLEAGADDFLTKPFSMDELRARIRAGERILQLQNALIRSQAALQFEVAHDALTGLWNRSAILELLMREVQRNQRSAESLGVMMVDLDYFKNVNDEHGHIAGDTVLRELGVRLVTSLRKYDLVGRYGGEEFLVVLPNCSASNLTTIAQRLRSFIASSPMQTSAGPLAITASVGVVSTVYGRQPPMDFETLLGLADEALYAAKAKGRNRVEVAGLATAAQSGLHR
jgi:two-component system, cell cycle response regulator